MVKGALVVGKIVKESSVVRKLMEEVDHFSNEFEGIQS